MIHRESCHLLSYGKEREVRSKYAGDEGCPQSVLQSFQDSLRWDTMDPDSSKNNIIISLHFCLSSFVTTGLLTRGSLLMLRPSTTRKKNRRPVEGERS